MSSKPDKQTYDPNIQTPGKENPGQQQQQGQTGQQPGQQKEDDRFGQQQGRQGEQRGGQQR